MEASSVRRKVPPPSEATLAEYVGAVRKTWREKRCFESDAVLGEGSRPTGAVTFRDADGRRRVLRDAPSHRELCGLVSS